MRQRDRHMAGARAPPMKKPERHLRHTLRPEYHNPLTVWRCYQHFQTIPPTPCRRMAGGRFVFSLSHLALQTQAAHASGSETDAILADRDYLPISLFQEATPAQLARVTCRIRALVAPPALCPGCLAQAGQPFPSAATTQHCAPCLAAIRSTYRAAKEARRC